MARGWRASAAASTHSGGKERAGGEQGHARGVTGMRAALAVPAAGLEVRCGPVCCLVRYGSLAGKAGGRALPGQATLGRPERRSSPGCGDRATE